MKYLIALFVLLPALGNAADYPASPSFVDYDAMKFCMERFANADLVINHVKSASSLVDLEAVEAFEASYADFLMGKMRAYGKDFVSGMLNVTLESVSQDKDPVPAFIKIYNEEGPLAA